MKSWNSPRVESISRSKCRNTASTQRTSSTGSLNTSSTYSIPEYPTPKYSKCSSAPQYWTPKYCEYGSMRSKESWNTASTSSIPQYTEPKYCDYMNYLMYFPSKMLYFTPRCSEQLWNLSAFLLGMLDILMLTCNIPKHLENIRMVVYIFSVFSRFGEYDAFLVLFFPGCWFCLFSHTVRTYEHVLEPGFQPDVTRATPCIVRCGPLSTIHQRTQVDDSYIYPAARVQSYTLWTTKRKIRAFEIENIETRICDLLVIHWSRIDAVCMASWKTCRMSVTNLGDRPTVKRTVLYMY